MNTLSNDHSDRYIKKMMYKPKKTAMTHTVYNNVPYSVNLHGTDSKCGYML